MKRVLKYISVIIVWSVLSCTQTEKKPLHISKLFSDHMVLQQQEEVAFWGEYTPNKKITLATSWGEEIHTESNIEGHWELKVPTPNAGGPHQLKISTKDSIIDIKDVMIGEVWIASGQSNMEMPLQGWPPTDTISNSSEEIKNANYNNIRMFTVKRNLSIKPIDSVTGNWQITKPENGNMFSATAYFFARRLHKELQIPIGIIHTSWGGTPAEAWTSKSGLKTLVDFDEVIASIEDPEAAKTTEEWFKSSTPYDFPDNEEAWQNMDLGDLEVTEQAFDDSKWTEVKLPNRFDEFNDSDINGAFWLRRTFEISNLKSDYTLTIGAVDDMDATYVNGQKVGGLAGMGYWNTKRIYNIPKEILKLGTNVIAIRAFDTGGPGTVSGPIELSSSQGNEISLEGSWNKHLIAEFYDGKIRVYGANTDFSKRPNTIFRLNPGFPTVLYNAMIHPVVPYSMKGAIWYQGESNVGRYEQYEKLFPAMIEDWRSQWKSEFPFYFVQIAPFQYNPNPSASISQRLREAQRKTLSVSNTGMVVTLDIGHPTNIHPGNKQDVGNRLAGLALSNDYDKNVIASGPLFKNVAISKNSLIINFDYVGSGLTHIGEELTGFEIAGADKNYFKATAKVLNNTVELSNPEINFPQYARYGWLDYFEATLFNKEGLPASSFTSEN